MDFQTVQNLSETEWKLKVVQELTGVKVNLKNLASNVDKLTSSIPKCEKDAIKGKVDMQGRLVFMMLATYIPMLVGLAYFVIKTYT